MTPELHAMLTGWLANGTEAQQAHARYRLSLPDADHYAGAGKPIEPRPTVAEALALLTAIRSCPHLGPAPPGHCGCLGTCGLGRGRNGLVAHHDCLACPDRPEITP